MNGFDWSRWRECEVGYPGAIAARQVKPYGVLYYNRDIPDSHDSNHAVIQCYDRGLEQAVHEIILFYKIRGLTPCVFPAYRREEQQVLIPLLLKNRFDIDKNNNRLFAFQSRLPVGAYPELKVRRITAPDQSIGEIFCGEDMSGTEERITNYLCTIPAVHVLAGFVENRPVCLAVLTTLQGMARLSDVLVARDYRGKGYGRALVQAVLDYHQSLFSNLLYLWTANPAAARLYEEAGFVQCGAPDVYWIAYKPK
jgi:GNAT superfamily N-acetyltransferase